MSITLSSIRCSLQVALLGAITNNLRAVNAVLNENSASLYFYYEKPPSEEECEISEVVASEVMSDFIDLSTNVIREVLPISNKIPERGIRIFHRYEILPHFPDGLLEEHYISYNPDLQSETFKTNIPMAMP